MAQLPKMRESPWADLLFRDQLRENALLQKFYCDIDIKDLISFNEELAHRLVSEPAEIIPLVSAPLDILEASRVDKGSIFSSKQH